MRKRLAAFAKLTFRGLDLVIDRPVGTVVSGVGPDGEYSIIYAVNYGFIAPKKDGEEERRTLGEDGQDFDTYVGFDLDAPLVFIGTQLDAKTGLYRQRKAFLGFSSKEAALGCAMAHQHPKMIGRMCSMTWERFVEQIEANRGTGLPAVIEADEDLEERHGILEVAADVGLNPGPAEDFLYPGLSSIRESVAPLFDRGFAEKRRADEPAIWSLARNGKPAPHFDVLARVKHEGGRARTPAELGALRAREAWAVRNDELTDLRSVVEQIQWLVISTSGEEAMKDKVKKGTATATPEAQVEETGAKSHVELYADLQTTLRSLAAFDLIGNRADAQLRPALSLYVAGEPGARAKDAGSPDAGGGVDDASVRGPNGPRERFTTIERVAIREGAREADYVASDETVDSYGEVVLPEWDFSRFEKNPVILWSHNSSEPPIGHAKRWAVEKRKLLITVYHSEAWDLARIVWDLVVERTVRACSVGFVPRDTQRKVIDGVERWVLGNNLLYELSLCSIPANPNALVEESVQEMAKAILKKAQERLRSTSLPGFGTPPASRAAPAMASPPVPAKAAPPATSQAGALDPDGDWDRASAVRSLRVMASSDASGDLETIDWSRFEKGFAWKVAVDTPSLKSFQFAHHHVQNGQLVTSKRGVMEAGAALMTATLSDDDRAEAQQHLERHYAEFNLTPPWKDEKAAGGNQQGDDTPMKKRTLMLTAVLLSDVMKKGQVDLTCEGCADVTQLVAPSEVTAAFVPAEALKQANEKAAAAEKAAADASAEVAREKAAKEAAEQAKTKADAELVKAMKDRDDARISLANIELQPLVGVEAFHMSQAEAAGLASLAVTNKTLYDQLVAERVAKFEKATGLKFERGAPGAAGGEGAQQTMQTETKAEGGQAAAPPTRLPDPTATTRAAGSIADPNGSDLFAVIDEAARKAMRTTTHSDSPTL